MNLLSDEILKLVSNTSNYPFKVVENDKFKCVEYCIELNLLTFCKLKLPVKITIIGLPLSVCKKGYTGDIYELIEYYKNQKGIFLILNDDNILDKMPYRSGKTLPTCIFKNRYNNFDEYLNSLRSSYRRRINIALNKGKNLIIKKIEKKDFTEEMYNLYLNVVEKSEYKLETLKKDFFKLFSGEIFGFFEKDKVIAFVLTEKINDEFYFIFGGMNYGYRDKYDLYYNMLIFILKQGIESNSKIIDFGQTAENSKIRIGCTLKNKYMHVCSGNKILDFILVKLIKILEYKFKGEVLRVLKDDK